MPLKCSTEPFLELPRIGMHMKAGEANSPGRGFGSAAATTLASQKNTQQDPNRGLSLPSLPRASSCPLPLNVPDPNPNCRPDPAVTRTDTVQHFITSLFLQNRLVSAVLLYREMSLPGRAGMLALY